MKRTEIDPAKLRLTACSCWQNDLFLLSSGDFAAGAFNVMTIAWGGVGCMWDRPLVLVVVRPTRYTYEFMEKYPDFTLNQFPPEFADKLDYCGSRSGRDVDKIKHCGFTPIGSREVAAPGFEEAQLILECRKIYFDDFDPQRFLADFIHKNYRSKDYHRLYFGQLKAAFGTQKYSG